VVPGNPDLVDTLGVEPPPFLHTSCYVDGCPDSGAGLLSHACRSPDGGARSSPSTQRFAALGEAAPANGGTDEIIEAPYDTISGRRVNLNERDTTYSKGGKVVYTTQAKLAKDGKTLTVIPKGRTW
jgi:hypothetical protein